MGWTRRIGDAWRSLLLSVSAYTAPPPSLPTLDSPQVQAARRAIGGHLTLQPVTKSRWYFKDLERAEYMADAGDMIGAGALMRAVDRDGVLCGVMSTRAGGLVRLPKRFRGPTDMVDALQQGGEQARSVFDEMFPASELEHFVADGVKLGIAVGELVPVEGRDYPVFVRLLPEYLQYRWAEGRWYYRSNVGPIPITPGDGRWILHTPGGRQAPWHGGLWRALGRAYITKDHARLHRDNWEAKLANAARVAVAPQGATESQKQGWFRKVMKWGVNTVFGMTPGYDVKLLESNGRGYESWKSTIAEQNEEFIIAVAGQTVTTDGGAGFANADIHKSIRADLIKATADSIAHTINTQGIPPWVLNVFGEERLAQCPTVEWDVTPPHDQTQSATALTSAATAVTALTDAFRAHGYKVDVEALATRFGIPLSGKLENIVQPKRLDLAPTDLAKVITAKEARSSQGLPPFGDERDDRTVSQLGEQAQAEADVEVADAKPQIAEAA